MPRTRRPPGKWPTLPLPPRSSAVLGAVSRRTCRCRTRSQAARSTRGACLRRERWSARPRVEPRSSRRWPGPIFTKKAFVPLSSSRAGGELCQIRRRRQSTATPGGLEAERAAERALFGVEVARAAQVGENRSARARNGHGHRCRVRWRRGSSLWTWLASRRSSRPGRCSRRWRSPSVPIAPVSPATAIGPAPVATNS